MINTSHYYGDIVRRLFLGAAALMLITLPFLQSFIPFPVFVSSFAALALTLCAGLIAPGRTWIVFLDLLVAGGQPHRRVGGLPGPGRSPDPDGRP